MNVSGLFFLLLQAHWIQEISKLYGIRVRRHVNMYVKSRLISSVRITLDIAHFVIWEIVNLNLTFALNVILILVSIEK